MSGEKTYSAPFHGHQADKTGMQYRQLGETDMRLSHLSLGGSGFGGVFGDIESQEIQKIVKQGLQSGINYIDTSPWYGQGKSEKELGLALKDIPRNVFYISTKVGRYNKEVTKMFDFSFKRTIESIDESLRRLGLKYVDIIFAHDIEFAPSIDIILKETLPALAQIKSAAKARYIGITGYNLQVLKEVVQKSRIRIDAVLSYCRHGLHDSSLSKYTKFFKLQGVGLINASPMAMGLFTVNEPPAWHPGFSDEQLMQAVRASIAYCKEKGFNISRLALLYGLANTDLTTTLTSCTSTLQLHENLSHVATPLTAADREVLKYFQEDIFEPIGNRNWEGIELEQYWKEMGGRPGPYGLERKRSSSGEENRQRLLSGGESPEIQPRGSGSHEATRRESGGWNPEWGAPEPIKE